VQPGQPVVAGHFDHRTVRQVDETLAAVKGALLAERVAVVPGDAGVHRPLWWRYRGLGHWGS